MYQPADLKYVIFLKRQQEVPVVFSKEFEHYDLVNAMSTVVSAGWCRIHITDGRFSTETFGESEALGRRSRLEDNEIIRRHLFPSL